MKREFQIKRSWAIAFLAAIILGAIFLNNARPIFSDAHYETGDLAANSLQVIRAKHFELVLGNYSRFGFYHPGPAFFYVYAAGEALFHDVLGIVPTPLNAQMIGLYALSAFFFSASLGVMSSWLDRDAAKWFISIALLLAAWHFGAVGKFYTFSSARPGLLCIWPPCVLVFPFLCFLISAASIAAGGGRDLHLMTLSACFLVHGHVGMPLFVVPITLLAYISLLLRLTANKPGRWLAAWRAFPKSHWVAAGIISIFLVPILADLLTAHPSNVRAIFEHLENSYGEKKGLLRSILYLTHFAAYTPYPSSSVIPVFENFDLRGASHFIGTHWRAYALWSVAIVTPFFPARRKLGVAFPGAKISDTDPVRYGAKKIRSASYLVIGCAIVLTLAWGCLQEGPMYYFNAHFNFAIYYSLLLVFAVTVADAIGTLVRRPGAPGSDTANWKAKVRQVGPGLILLLAIAAFVRAAPQFRDRSDDSRQQALLASSLERALKSDTIRPKLLVFEGQAWVETVGVALYLERAGIEWYVASYAPNIPLIFGRDRAIPEKETSGRVPDASVWRIVSATTSAELRTGKGDLIALPLTGDIDLVLRPSP